MTTKSVPSSTRDQLTTQSGQVTSNGERSQSAAVRGANRAYIARGENQDCKATHSNSSGARAAAVSAGYASRQESVSPPKDPNSAVLAVPRTQSASVSQVRQLVKGLEQAATADKRHFSSAVSGTSLRQYSRSPSTVAARLAASTSITPPRQILPLRNGARDNVSVLPTRPPLSNHGFSHNGSRLPSGHPEDSQFADEDATVAALQPLQPVTIDDKYPATLSSDQLRIHAKEIATKNSHQHQLQGSSSLIAAQAAVRHLAPLNLSSAFDPPRRIIREVFASENANSEGMDRGRSLASRGDVPESKLEASNTSYRSISDKPRRETGDSEVDDARSERKLAKHVPHARTSSTQSGRHPSTIPNAQYLDTRTGLTEVSLADAIVASSLASSRAPSPSKKVPAPPPPRRSSLSLALFRHRHSSDTDLPRHGGPHQGMKHTLRRYESDTSSDDDDRRKHKHFMKHPNKHHEGSRKRWKDRVAERERKRYEGVWAANKGLFLTTTNTTLPHLHPLPSDEPTPETAASEIVLDLVVRDIWSRSRLPNEVLAEIWDLVDRHGLGVLTRDEFVLGLWLIDQKLKGRKLPIRISPTLWASVRHAWGVKVPRRL
jgi:hypothetical protein